MIAKKFLSVALLMSLSVTYMVALANAAVDEPLKVTVMPAPSDEPILNPGKGWVLGWYPESNPPKDLEYGNVGYTRFEWGEIEPQEGKYNWEPIDRLITSWAAIGKQCAFGVMCTNTGVDRYVTPKWVFEAGVPVRIWERRPYDENDPRPDFLVWNGPTGKEKIHGEQTWEVMDKPIDLKPGYCVEVADYHHPLFLEKLRNFLTAMAKRYDGNPHIAYIDIRSYLNYGEQFSLKHIKLHMDIFKKTRLCQSCGHYGDYPEFDWAAKQGVAIRRDGIGGSDGRECTRAFGYAPAVFEFWGAYDFVKSQGWWREGKMLREAVEIGKPSYIALPVCAGGSLLDVHKEEIPLIKELTNRMGYHFVLKKAEYPAIMQAYASAKIKLTWQNKGVAPVYVPCVVAIGFLDDKGREIAKCWPSGCDPARWYPDKEITEEIEVAFPKVAPGSYNICVGLFHNIGDEKPAFKLGIATSPVNGWYQLGKIDMRY